jgi:hypothetical protein
VISGTTNAKYIMIGENAEMLARKRGVVLTAFVGA